MVKNFDYKMVHKTSSFLVPGALHRPGKFGPSSCNSKHFTINIITSLKPRNEESLEKDITNTSIEAGREQVEFLPEYVGTECWL